ncbi:uncharacterized protein LOC133895711 [Phragmites australis]|uniref:uncharacterized protein LOC133895711 n=1 Tax=Phragmites australis TaxID=29695 RepID=UPI002D79BB40|nr:uncharacterized protein LOC133895711 [Phragmites australis]
MSCFGATYSSSGMRGRRRPWRWWRTKCACIAATVGSRIRRSIKALDGRRRSAPLSSSWSVHRGWCHHRQHRGVAPVYVDELYNHHQPAKALNLNVVVQEEPTTSGSKLVAAGASGKQARTGAASAAASGVGAMRSVLMRSPGRGGGVLAVVKGMGEVDLRAELFIRRFKEDMRLQSQRSAEEFQAMLARGL